MTLDEAVMPGFPFPVIPPIPPIPVPPVPPGPPPPTQASSKTVTSIAIPFLQVVLNLDPAFERDKHDELFYPFGEAGHRARNFYGDPYASGPYAPPLPGAPHLRFDRQDNGIEIGPLAPFPHLQRRGDLCPAQLDFDPVGRDGDPIDYFLDEAF